MKKFTLVIPLLLLFCAISAQVHNGDIILLTQSHVDSVSVLYPGDSVVIDGVLQIGGNWDSPSDITDLSPLSGIVESKKGLVIHHNPFLTSLSDLKNLLVVDVILEVAYNERLTSLDGLDQITSFSSNSGLYIQENTSLYDLCPISTLVANLKVNDYYSVFGNYINPIQSEFATACDITYGDEIYAGNVVVRTQAEVDALSKLLGEKTEISGDVKIGEEFGKESDINDLSAFSGISRINGSLLIQKNPILESLSGLDNIQSIGGYELAILANKSLTQFCALTGFAFADNDNYHDLRIEGNGYNPDPYNFTSSNCQGDLEKPILPKTFIPDWQPGQGGEVPFPEYGEPVSDFIGLYLKENIYSSYAFSDGGYTEMILAPTNAMGYGQLVVECSEDSVTWTDFMDNREEPAIIRDGSYPVICPNKAYYYRLRTPDGKYSNVIYVDRFAYKVAFSSTGSGGSDAWPPMYVTGQYRVYDRENGYWTEATDNSLLTYQWYRINPVTYDFEVIDSATNNRYYPTAEDIGYYLGATITFDNEIDGVACYASCTQVNSSIVKFPIPTYISNVTSTGFDINSYYCIEPDLIEGFEYMSVYAFEAGCAGDIEVSGVESTDSCGTLRVNAIIPETVTSFEMMCYSEGKDFVKIVSAREDEMSHHEGMIMWKGNVGYYNGDVMVSSQREVDSLVQQLDGYRGIDGDWEISGNRVSDKSSSVNLDLSQPFTIRKQKEGEDDPITDLSVLQTMGIGGVTGDLIVRNTTRLQSLEGLGALSVVGDDVRIIDNASLSTLAGLDNVEFADSLYIEKNSVLFDYSSIKAMSDNLDTFVVSANYYNPTTEDIESGNGATQASVIYLSGDIAFGTATVGTSARVDLTIYNVGNKTMTITGFSMPEVYAVDWSGGDIPADGEQNVTITFTPTAVETYAGTIEINGDFDVGENKVEVYGVGSASSNLDQITQQTVNVYPNPFGNEMSITDVELIEYVDVLNLQGQSVKKITLPNRTIDMSDLKPGFYMIRIQMKDEAVVMRSVLKK